jgi:hypothetical protein
MLRELRAEDGELSPGSTAAPRRCFRLIASVSVTDPETPAPDEQREPRGRF